MAPMRVSGSKAFSVLSFELFKSSAATAPPTKTLVCLHGILGSKKNWRTPSKIFTKEHPEFIAIAMDHRGHGASPSTLPGANTVASSAKDVLHTLEFKALPTVFQNAPPTILCGHSYSGKVVLHILDQLTKAGKPLPEHVWILDSLPGTYDKVLDRTHKQSVVGIIDTVFDLPSEFESKEWIEKHLHTKGFARPIIDWLSTNIVPVENEDGTLKTPHAFKYSFDITTVKNLFDDFCDTEMWTYLENYKGTATLHFLQAGKNAAWSPEIVAKFEELSANNAHIKHHKMPHVGHWLHAEDVHGMSNLIATHSDLQ